MKTRVQWTWSLGLVLVVLPLHNQHAQPTPGELADSSQVVAPEGQLGSAVPGIPNQSGAPGAQATQTDLADAAFQPIPTDRPLPSNVKPTAPVAEVIRLAESGVEEGVILAYVTNSPNLFNLNPDGIIYLNDLGLPGAVVSAMIQRDQALKAMPNQSAPAPQEPAPDLVPPPMPQPPEDATSQPMPPPDYGPVDSTLPPPDDGAYSTFYDALAPYGTWVDVAGYGPCWQPTVVVSNPYWQPYCNGGRWVYTDSGWYWLSSYSWGWAPFHYGRWFYHHHLGWCWAPDSVWGPSWVCWRYGTAYCGWAPLPPGAWYRTGVGLTYRGKPVGNTFGFGLSARSFAVVSFNHFWDPHLARYALPQKQASQVLSKAVFSASIVSSNNRIINNGLPPARVEASTGLGIRSVAVRDASAASRGMRAERLDAGGGSVSVFRPTGAPHAGKSSGGGGSQPVLHYAPGPSSQNAGGNGRYAVTETTPRGALVVIGKKQLAPGQTFTYPSAREVPQLAASAHDNSSRADLNQRPQPKPQRPPMPAWSPPPPAPVEQHYEAPSYHPPEAPHPTYTPPPAYSPPPPAPAPAPAHSSSDRFGR
jgi:hypothetical protein